MKEEIVEKISELKKKIMVLEWDTARKQINTGKTKQLEEFKKELEVLQASEIEQKPIVSTID